VNNTGEEHQFWPAKLLFPPCFKLFLKKIFISNRIKYILQFNLHVFDCIEISPLELQFHFGKGKEVKPVTFFKGTTFRYNQGHYLIAK